MITWGINALNHDASITVFKNGVLKFWKRSSEYTGQPGDDQLNIDLVRDAFKSVSEKGPDEIIWYERPWLKKTRQAYAGQWGWALDLDELPTRYLKKFGLGYAPISYMPHHLSHAAAGFLTSPFEESTVVVLDAIGEWESATIWRGRGTKLEKLWSRNYPTSLGVFYSAFTHLLGLIPVGEEHILQQWSDRGNPYRFLDQVKSYWVPNWKMNRNLHKGVRDWPFKITDEKYDIAASVQHVFEKQAQEIMDTAKKLSTSDNLIYMGGCAMNSKFNKTLDKQWKGIWSLPIPGDSSSAIGAVLYKKQIRIRWDKELAKHIPLVYNKS
jgi:carbamoyltransferase